MGIKTEGSNRGMVHTSELRCMITLMYEWSAMMYDYSNVWTNPTSDVWRVHSYIGALMFEHAFRRICAIIRSLKQANIKINKKLQNLRAKESNLFWIFWINCSDSIFYDWSQKTNSKSSNFTIASKKPLKQDNYTSFKKLIKFCH